MPYPVVVIIATTSKRLNRIASKTVPNTPLTNPFSATIKVTPMIRRFEALKGKDLAKFDLIVGSDVCFWDSMVKPLYQLINRAMKNGVERVIITDPGRPTFYELCDMCRKKHKVELQEWYATEPSHTTGEVVEIRPA